MNGILEFLVNPAVQMIMWVIAGSVILYFRKFMTGVVAWDFIAAGVLIYGVRIGLKLLPGYNTSIPLQVFRFSFGILGLTILLIGIIVYYYNNIKPIMGDA